MSRYPKPPRGDDASDWHGRRVPDPYRALEDVGSPQTAAWLEAQKKLTDDYFAREPRMKTVAATVERCAPASRILGSAMRGGRWLFYVASDSALGTGVFRVAIDGGAPERLALKTDLVPAAEHIFPSPTGRYVAIGARAPAGEAMTILVYDCQRGALLADEIAPGLLPIAAWLPDETGFFYNAIRGVHWMQGSGEPSSTLCLHRLGKDDEAVATRPWGEGTALIPFVAPRGEYLVVQATNLFDSRTSILAAPLAAPKKLVQLLPERASVTRAFAEKNGEIFVATTSSAGHSEVIALRPVSAGKDDQRVALTLPADEIKLTVGACASPAILTDTGLAIIRHWAGEDHLTFYDAKGRQERSASFPVPVDINSVQAIGADAFAVVAQSFLEPATIVRCEASSGTAQPLPHFASLADSTGAGYDRVSFISSGASASMIVIRRKGARSDDRVLVLAYGGIGVSLGPKFSLDVRAWLELGGTAAIVHVRGGGEYGAAWHKAGSGENKQNSFIDLRRALEVLAQSGVDPSRIVVRAKSLGGLLTGYAYNVFPELMGALISEMPLLVPLDTLASKQGGHMRQELGDPAKDKAAFERIIGYSPIDNLTSAKRKPAHLIVCGDKDERVFAGWVYKYVAAAQHVATDDQDVLLLRVEGAGHTQMPAALARDLTVRALTFALHTTERATS